MATSTKAAYDTKVLRAAQEISARIAGLSEIASDEQVLTALRDQKCSPEVLCSAFWLLDNQPSRFPSHQTWHPRLRRLRNNPEVGERMFALFK